MKTEIPHSLCPYGTYQRAIAGHRTRALTPRLVIRCIRAKLKPSARRSQEMRPWRKCYYRGAIAHWREEVEMMNQFRL